MRYLLILAAGSLCLWAVLAGPGWLIWGEGVFYQSATAMALCLMPSLASLAWLVYGKHTPEQQLMAILGGTGIRIAVAFGGGFLLVQTLPSWFPNRFLLWVGVFYLGVLAMEVSLALSVRAEAR